MASFWITKEMALEALKMSEGMPKDTFICIDGKSEVMNGKEYTVTGKLMYADGTGEVSNVTVTASTFTPDTPNGTTVALSNKCDERYNCDKAYIQKTFFEQFK